jgi:hypothetical protein
MRNPGPNQDPLLIDDDTEPGEPLEPGTYFRERDDEEEPQDLGFIVDDHDDRRGTLTENFQRLDDLDTNEPLETNRSGPIPHEAALRADPNPPDVFATDYHVSHEDGERQEEDFMETSMPQMEPDVDEDLNEDGEETLENVDGDPMGTDITGRVYGVADGMGTSMTLDFGRGGFQVEDNPLASAAPDEGLLAARENGGELDDYDEDKQEDPRERVDLGADLDAAGFGDPSIRGRGAERANS